MDRWPDDQTPYRRYNPLNTKTILLGALVVLAIWASSLLIR